jgi:hypothetical protein
MAAGLSVAVLLFISKTAGVCPACLQSTHDNTVSGVSHRAQVSRWVVNAGDKAQRWQPWAGPKLGCGRTIAVHCEIAGNASLTEPVVPQMRTRYGLHGDAGCLPHAKQTI